MFFSSFFQPTASLIIMSCRRIAEASQLMRYSSEDIQGKWPVYLIVKPTVGSLSATNEGVPVRITVSSLSSQ